MYGQRVRAPSCFEVVLNTNHHLSKPAMIGKLDASGSFDVVWRSISPIKASVWSRYLPENAKRTADISLGLRRMYRADLQGLVIVSFRSVYTDAQALSVVTQTQLGWRGCQDDHDSSTDRASPWLLSCQGN
ncbi:transporter substrate-binding protein [Bradyrhizobium sp. 6(2017)]|uniref:transporter substrate-binding protein n=1 Tax=Bradyrhizobium sp. 6(2017) TaxID=1197460 RepID=UPI0013E1447D|nr:transporter substrate-binding protein [Bradyrhizobium sp. 6(2017)]